MAWCSGGVGRAVLGVLGAGALVVTVDAAAGLPPLAPDTERGWVRFVGAVEERRAREAWPFTRADAPPGRAVRIEEVGPPKPGGAEVTVPRALVHHWRGVVFIPGVTAHGLAAAIERDGPDPGQADVLEGRILERRADGTQRVFLRVKRSKVITVVYDTEHLVRFTRPSSDRAASTSAATRLVEIEDAGQAGERAVAPGDDHGFLWRWQAYWRYQDVAGGVLVECESLSLSRTVPAVVRFVAGPIIRSTAREAMESTLVALRDRYAAGSVAR